MFRIILTALILLPACVAQAPRGLIDTIQYKQAGTKAGLQFAWAYKGQVQIPKPVFRGLIYYADEAGNLAMLEGGSLSPELDSREAALKGRVPAKGNERILIDLPGAVKLHDFRVEMWLNGHLVGTRNSSRFDAAAFPAKGLDPNWWVAKVGKLDEQLITDINACIENGAAWLRKQQKADGHWEGDQDSPTGYTSLAALALIKAGAEKDAPAITKALAWLKNNEPVTTYDHGCLIMLLEAIDAEAHRDWIKKMADEISRVQASGTWSYEAGDGDLSNTQYGALSLWTAQRAGIEIKADVWRELGEAVAKYANPNGSFNYEPKVRKNAASQGTLPMSAAGTAIARICYEMTDGDQKATKLRTELVKIANDGYAATARLFGVRASGYSLYGIERAAALMDRDLLGRQDWYKAGAEIFIERQEDDGSVGEVVGGKLAGTSFALLFLRRSTRSAMDSEYDPDAHLSDSVAMDASNAVDEAIADAPAPAVDPIEAAFNERYPFVKIGEEVTLTMLKGRKLTGVVKSLMPSVIVMEVNGNTGGLQYGKLDNPSRARCDAAFRKQAIEAQRKR